MVSLSGQPAEIGFTLTITRAATGLTEEVEMVGHVTYEPEGADNGRDTLECSPVSSD